MTEFATLGRGIPIPRDRLLKNGSTPLDEVGIHATDDYVLTVELEFPATYFLESTALMVYSPIPHTVDNNILVGLNKKGLAMCVTELFVLPAIISMNSTCLQKTLYTGISAPFVSMRL